MALNVSGQNGTCTVEGGERKGAMVLKAVRHGVEAILDHYPWAAGRLHVVKQLHTAFPEGEAEEQECLEVRIKKDGGPGVQFVGARVNRPLHSLGDLSEPNPAFQPLYANVDESAPYQSRPLVALQTWVLYEKQQQLQIVDERMQKAENSLDTNMNMNVNEGEVIRVVHVALLCTQLQPQARPSMSEVHNMLCGQLEILNLPTKPMTIGIISPIGDLLHDGSSGMFSRSNMPSWTAQPSVKLTYSNNADPSSQVEPR